MQKPKPAQNKKHAGKSKKQSSDPKENSPFPVVFLILYRAGKIGEWRVLNLCLLPPLQIQK
jgi:hypothetical protein